MITLFTRLTLCFALLYSINSAAYNEAMCILIKQEMQQHSNDKTSRNYRNAVRDHSKNCIPSKQVQTQIKTVPITAKPTPVVEKTSEAVSEAITETVNKNVVNEQQAPTVEPLTDNKNQAMLDAKPVNHKPQANPKVVIPEQKPTPPNTPIKSDSTLTKEVLPAPLSTLKPAPTLIPTQTSEPVVKSTHSLLLPSLILLIVVLIAVMAIVRLRRAKQNKETTAISSVAQTLPTPTTPPLNASKAKVAEPAADNINKKPTINALDQKKSAILSEPIPQLNTAEFEAAANNAVARIKSANDFNEPEVRKFDPDALAINNPHKHESAVSNDQKGEELVSEPAIITPELIHSPAPNENAHAVEKVFAPQATLFSNEHDFKEPEVRTFDPDAPLPGVKIQEKPKPVEPKVKAAKIDSSNPFANLSLDPSWDPESTEKPVIEKKKRTPKSQALIDAEARAKSMQTKE
ncbi:cell surface protein [Pseudoalteromonas sp. SG45-5]|uniref:cell surface protein n=1 Tax=unclassified Pseudoalteromonas TaxID=194690 RepID=UPI0015FA1F52|nr:MULTISPECIES: cell surface protein [unclassified Pseudoalteromonas]MBB1387621.1 cell surface protein [Pseudoalteromonas sp. SG45-5]MBB1395840.1 cell surface protein [Pseudoalteromonas sp. SG44-4]MBB1448740.1 cell surface protein [Pseudoalteromonas sp. SG41-6]